MASSNEQVRVLTKEHSGCVLHGWVSGSGSAPLVVLIHGATMDHRMFDSQLPPLLAAGYQVMTVDLRGHGHSKLLGHTPISVPALADDVLALINEIAVDRFVVVGQSLGGYVAQDLVLRHPHRVIALGIIGATATTIPISRLDSILLRSSVSWFRFWPYNHLKDLMVKSLAHRADVQIYAREAMSTLTKSEFLTIWGAVTQVHRPLPEYRIEQPLLLTHGDQDRTGNIRAVAPAWAARDPKSSYVVIPNARHNANQDNPEFFNQILLKFLAEYAQHSDVS